MAPTQAGARAPGVRRPPRPALPPPQRPAPPSSQAQSSSWFHLAAGAAPASAGARALPPVGLSFSAQAKADNAVNGTSPGPQSRSPPSSLLGGVVLAEIHVHLHADCERPRLGEVDQHFHHVDSRSCARSARGAARRLDQGRDERDRSGDLAPAKRGGAHHGRLPDRSPHSRSSNSARTQCRNVAEQHERLRRRRRRQFPALAFICRMVPPIGARTVIFSSTAPPPAIRRARH